MYIQICMHMYELCMEMRKDIFQPLSHQVQLVGAAYIAQHRAVFIHELGAFTAQHGYAPHPATLVALAAAAVKKQGHCAARASLAIAQVAEVGCGA